VQQPSIKDKLLVVKQLVDMLVELLELGKLGLKEDNHIMVIVVDILVVNHKLLLEDMVVVGDSLGVIDSRLELIVDRHLGLLLVAFRIRDKLLAIDLE
jgi:hypothetical protein